MHDEAVFRHYVSAYNRKDLPAMLGCFASNCLFENISAGKVSVRAEGKVELEQLARKSADVFAWREQKVLSVTQAAGRIAAEIQFAAVLQADLPPNLIAGSRLELRGVSVLEFSAGKIVRLTDYS